MVKNRCEYKDAWGTRCEFATKEGTLCMIHSPEYKPSPPFITNLSGISGTQLSIMEHINEWAHHNKVPITRKRLFASLSKKKINRLTAITALRVLIAKGYIRRAVTLSNTTSFVMLRGL